MTSPNPDILLRLRPPAEPEDASTRRLRRAMKTLGRQYGLRVVKVQQVVAETPGDAQQAPAAATPRPDPVPP